MNKIFQIIQLFLLLVSVSAPAQETLIAPGQEALIVPGQEALIAPGQEALIAPGQEALIVLEEGFEAGSVQDVLRNWDDSQNVEGMSLSNDVPEGSSGQSSLMMTYKPGENSGGHLFKLLPGGFDVLYARFYVKFMAPHRKVHHLVKMGGNNPPSSWPLGKAGVKPAGDDRFITGIEPIGDSWSWDFYSYWMHMRGYGDPDLHWGNTFHPHPPAKIKQGEWICVEFMMKMNDPPDSFNGEQAFWINGVKILQMGGGKPNGYWIKDRFYPDGDSAVFEGFQWRNTEKLNINYFWLSYYMTDVEGDQTDAILFDDVVLSTKYIGPLNNESKK